MSHRILFPAVGLMAILASACGSSDADSESELDGDQDQGELAAAGMPIVQEPGISYVPMPPSTVSDMTLIMEAETQGLEGNALRIGNNTKKFISRMSRGRVNFAVRLGEFKANKPSEFTKVLRLIPGASSNGSVIGNGASAYHELGHQLGFGHGDTRIFDEDQTTLIKGTDRESDPFDPMTTVPLRKSFNAPHLHQAGWFNSTEEAYAEVDRKYTLRVINDGSAEFKSLKSLYYEVPGTPRRVFFSYVKVPGPGWKAPGMPGTALVAHELVGGATFFEGTFGLDVKTHRRSGLILEVSEVTPTTVTFTVKKDPSWEPLGSRMPSPNDCRAGVCK